VLAILRARCRWPAPPARVIMGPPVRRAAAGAGGSAIGTASSYKVKQTSTTSWHLARRVEHRKRRTHSHSLLLNHDTVLDTTQSSGQRQDTKAPVENRAIGQAGRYQSLPADTAVAPRRPLAQKSRKPRDHEESAAATPAWAVAHTRHQRSSLLTQSRNPAHGTYGPRDTPTNGRGPQRLRQQHMPEPTSAAPAAVAVEQAAHPQAAVTQHPDLLAHAGGYTNQPLRRSGLKCSSSRPLPESRKSLPCTSHNHQLHNGSWTRPAGGMHGERSQPVRRAHEGKGLL